MTNTPLKPELHKALVEHIDKVCAVNNGWYKAHIVASAALWATGELTEGLTAELEEFPDYLTEEDIGVPVSPSQYLTAALDYCGKQVTAWDKAEDKVDAFNNAYWVLPQAEAYGLKTGKAVAALVTRKPEWVEPVCVVLLDGDNAPDETWETVLSSPELREALKPQLIAKAPEINANWNEGESEPYDWLSFGEEVVVLMAEAGVPSQPKDKSHSAYIEEMCRQSQEIGKRQGAERKAAEAEAAAEKSARDPASIFFDALNDCVFEEIFADAETYKALIEEHIEDIAGNFCEGNEYSPTGDEPAWLIKFLVDYGAEVG